MLAIDCNVLVHLLLDGEQTPRARTLLEQDADWHSDALLLIELTNVLATAIRVRGLPMTDAVMALTQAQGVVAPGLHSANHHEVLATAEHYRVSSYDAHYLVVARELGVRLVTEDARLRKAAPKLTQSLADAVGY